MYAYIASQVALLVHVISMGNHLWGIHGQAATYCVVNELCLLSDEPISEVTYLMCIIPQLSINTCIVIMT